MQSRADDACTEAFGDFVGIPADESKYELTFLVPVSYTHLDVYKRQGPYTDQLLLETIPAKVGITGSDLTAFRACYSNQNLARFVQAVDDAAGKAGINETPTLTVNGTAVPISSFDGKTGEDLKGIIEDAAKR